MWKVKSAIVSAVMLLGLTFTHFAAHAYTRLEAYALGHFQASKRALISDIATNLGYAPVSEPDEELSPHILCTMEAVRQDVNPAFACSLLLEESGGDPFAVSPKGARGLMQIMPANHRMCAEQCAVKSPNDLFDAQKNVCCGVHIFNTELKRYGDDPIRALESYNGGGGCVGKCRESLEHRRKVLKRAVRVVS